MSLSDTDPRFEDVVRRTRVVRPPRQTLATFGVTTICYYLVTEPVYSELESEKGYAEAVVRDGTVKADRPRVVTPHYLLNSDGFGSEAREYLQRLAREYGPDAPGVLYGYKNEPNATEIVSGGVSEVADRIGKRLDAEEKHLAAVIQGVDELWDVSLMKFIFDLTNSSVQSNVAELQSSGLLEMNRGVPMDARRRIDRMLEQARLGRAGPAEVHRELERWGLFDEYQDRFFELFKRH